MSDRATCWSVTINNPLPADDENIALAKQKSGWKVEGQLEKGENGTPHYQLMVKTPQVRFGSIKKAFPRAHIEPARNVKALAEYVHKSDTKVAELPVNDKYPSLTVLWDLFDIYLKTSCEVISNDQDDRLRQFDDFIACYIELGYHVETMGVNPQVRSAVKKYGVSLVFRAQKLRRQKIDRQTELISEVESIHDGEESESDQTEGSEETASTTSSSSG
jgi:hypothetical protein